MLPEHKKTPEELNALRAKMGIPNVIPTDILDATPVAKLQPDSLSAIESVAAPAIDPKTGLPAHRHNNDELERIRLRGMLDAQYDAMHRPLRRERTVIVIAGYLLALSAVVPIYYKLPVILPLGIELAALAFGVYLFLLRPYSKHHGAFIGVVVLFVLTYTALQYFPQLRHAT